MKLYYWQAGKDQSNFGDELNLWLWERLISDLLDDDESITLIGIGTLLNDVLKSKTPNAQKRIIFSTGVGYDKTNQFELDDSYQVYCVRGPLSARRLHLDAELGIADGALLIKNLVDLPSTKKYACSYMPHLRTMNEAIADACQELGFGYILPTWPVEKVMEAINASEFLIAEAMHGAIVADALRVPWTPVITHPSIYKFKWMDWCASLQIEYLPEQLEVRPYLKHVGADFLVPVRKLRNQIKNQQTLREIKASLLRLKSNASFYLSNQTVQTSLIERLEEKLFKLREDHHSIS
jgi:succinoglycan biosynthesis protein ExoV